MNNTDHTVDQSARELWDYLCLNDSLVPSDFILALGSHDLRVAYYARDLYLRGIAGWFVASGGFGKVTRGLWNVPEGEKFAAIAIEGGVPESRVIVETGASNTGDNIANVRAMLAKDNRIPTRTGLLVTKPYMRRRAYATACRQWPEIDWHTAGPQLSYEAYPDTDVPKSRMINLMVGDLQRMKVYAEQGFQIHQDIPDPVWMAYETLVRLGFDQFVIK